jgi:hypothetical protein
MTTATAPLNPVAVSLNLDRFRRQEDPEVRRALVHELHEGELVGLELGERMKTHAIVGAVLDRLPEFGWYVCATRGDEGGRLA